MFRATTVLLFLAACASLPTVRATRADAQGVTFEFPSGHQDEATRQATLYCANLGRAAVLERTGIAAGDLAVAVYECR